MIFKLILLTIAVIGFAFAAIGIKMFLKKNGEFKKQCSTVDTKTGQRIGCTCGSESGADTCHNN